MALTFTNIKPLNLKHSNFNMGFDNKFTCDFGDLIPICVQECLPGDVLKYNLQNVVRTIPALAPVLHRVQIRAEAFFVPNRLVWEDWSDFITGGPDGQSEAVMPYILNEYQIEEEEEVSQRKYTLWDYFGLPFCPRSSDVIDPDLQVKVCALPFYAYNLVFNEYYRNENVDNEISLTSLDIQSRRWSPNDFFISALPFLQRGVAPNIEFSFGDRHLDLGGTISGTLTDPTIVARKTEDNVWISDEYPDGRVQSGVFGDGKSGISMYRGYTYSEDDDIPLKSAFYTSTPGSYPFGTLIRDNVVKSNQVVNDISNAYADLTGESAGFSAEQIRRLMSAERFLERNSRSGYRYTEQLLSRFGVYIGDYRIQRPEFLGSIKSDLTFAEIPQTSATSATSPQGNLSGKGIGGSSSSVCRYRCREHGYFLVLFSILPFLSYSSQGIEKKWRRNSKFDYYTPEFAHLSEQKIEKSEIYCEAQNAHNVETFGYNGIYDDYRYNSSIVTSDFRDNYEYWHLARKFSDYPALNTDFLSISSDVSSLNRIFAVQNIKPFLCDVYNDLYMSRPVPTFAEPGISTF